MLPWDGGLESLPAAHAAAILFDLLVAGLLLLAGRRLREGGEGRDLGVALAFAWFAYPYTLYALDANGGNDALVAALLVAALIAFASPLKRGLAIGLAAATKFGPLALAPLFAAGSGERRIRSTAIFGAAFVAVWAVVLLPLLPDGGFREFYDRTFGYQASRGSPFSVWGLEPSLGGLQDLARAFPVLLGVAVYFLPGRRTALQVAALGAAVLIATQVGSTHWFYFFILWWTPYVLINVFSTPGADLGPRSVAERSGDRRAELAELRRADDQLVAGLQPDPRIACAADAGGRPGRDDVARDEGHQRREVGQELRDAEDQLGGGLLLHPLAVQVECDARAASGPPGISSAVTRAGPHGADPSKTLPGSHWGVWNWRSRAERSLSSV